MKEFNKWAKENGYLYSDGVPRTGVRRSWKAALEWAYDSADDIIGVVENIEKELEK